MPVSCAKHLQNSITVQRTDINSMPETVANNSAVKSIVP